MKLADFVVPEAIIAELRATTKEAAFREMVGALRAAGYVGEADSEDVVRAILHREGLGTTAFGQIGVAFPEARHPAVGRTLGAVALSRGGVEFAAAYPAGGWSISCSWWSPRRTGPVTSCGRWR